MDDKQAAGVMGNIYVESKFSPSNAQDSYGYYGIYDSDYSYATKDGVGYGLVQWTYSTRKQTLQNVAQSMNYPMSNINSQLACIREELINGEFKTAYKTLKACTSVDMATEVFASQYEKPASINYTTRKSYANLIYNAIV